MFFRRTVYLLGLVATVLVLRVLLPAAEQWPTALWVGPLLFLVFVVAPFLIALDIREGREAKSEDVTRPAGQ